MRLLPRYSIILTIIDTSSVQSGVSWSDERNQENHGIECPCRVPHISILRCGHRAKPDRTAHSRGDPISPSRARLQLGRKTAAPKALPRCRRPERRRSRSDKIAFLDTAPNSTRRSEYTQPMCPLDRYLDERIDYGGLPYTRAEAILGTRS